MSHRPVSSSTSSVRMFDSNFVEALSKIPPWVPAALFLPAVAWFSWQAFAVAGDSAPAFLGALLGGLFIWTATEYSLHRFVFHWLPPGRIGARLHFIFHGVHHDYPNDALRLVMPPSVSVPLACLFHWLFSLAVPATLIDGFFAGFLLGYVTYDTLHYSLHHFAFEQPLFKWLKRNHMQHHFVTPERRFGVSSPLWDWLLGTGAQPR
jgi:sterol desaturase/sphingolipid hydroxylase (fatty acid hydroxylase superfamily)